MAEHNKSGQIRTRDIYYVQLLKSDFVFHFCLCVKIRLKIKICFRFCLTAKIILFYNNVFKFFSWFSSIIVIRFHSQFWPLNNNYIKICFCSQFLTSGKIWNVVKFLHLRKSDFIQGTQCLMSQVICMPAVFEQNPWAQNLHFWPTDYDFVPRNFWFWLERL